MSKKISGSLFHDPGRSPVEYEVDPLFSSSMNSKLYPEYYTIKTVSCDFYFHFVDRDVLLGRALYSHRSSLHPGVLKIWDNLTECWEYPCDGTASHPGEAE